MRVKRREWLCLQANAPNASNIPYPATNTQKYQRCLKLFSYEFTWAFLIGFLRQLLFDLVLVWYATQICFFLPRTLETVKCYESNNPLKPWMRKVWAITFTFEIFEMGLTVTTYKILVLVLPRAANCFPSKCQNVWIHERERFSSFCKIKSI